MVREGPAGIATTCKQAR